MTIKTFKKRVITLLNDNHSFVLEGEALEAWKDQQKEISAHQAELARRDREMMSHWFEQDAYVNGTWLKRAWMRLQYLFLDLRGETRMPPIPDHMIMEVARCLLPNIIAFYETEEGREAFRQWKEQQAAQEEKEESKVS